MPQANTTTVSVTISVPENLMDLIDRESGGNRSRLFVQGVKRQIVWGKRYGAVRSLFFDITGEEETGETEPVTFNCPLWLKRHVDRHLDELVMSMDGFIANCVTKYLINKDYDSTSLEMSPLAEALVNRLSNNNSKRFEGILP